MEKPKQGERYPKYDVIKQALPMLKKLAEESKLKSVKEFIALLVDITK